MEFGIFLLCLITEVISSEEINKSSRETNPPEIITALNKERTERTQRFSLNTLSGEDQPATKVISPLAYRPLPRARTSQDRHGPTNKQSSDIGENKANSNIHKPVVPGGTDFVQPRKQSRYWSSSNSKPIQSKQTETEELNMSGQRTHSANNNLNVCSNNRINEPGMSDMNHASVHSFPTLNGLSTDQNDFVDSFICGICVCFCKNEKFLNADCAYRKTRDIPRDLPQQIWSLDMSGNNITNLSFSNLQYYPSLNHFKVSCDRQLERITSSSLASSSRMFNLQILDLSENKIDHSDDASFEVFPSLRNLTLRGNVLKQITNMTFFGLRNLIYLDLSSNFISDIDVDAFRYFINLKQLDLSCNPLLGYSTEKLSLKLFSSLKNLTGLFIHGVSGRRDSVYPNKTFIQMPHLQRLSVDGLNTEFGPELLKLQNLQHLEMGSSKVCHLKNITGSFFENVPFLRSFYLVECHSLIYINPAAFSKVHLQTLTFQSLPSFDLFTALRVLIGLQNSSLTELRLIHLYNNTFYCKALRDEDAKYFSYLTLEVLDLTDNLLIYISKTVIDNLPNSLRILVLRNNRLTSDRNPLTKFSGLHNLIQLDISYQNMVTTEQKKSDHCPKVTDISSRHEADCRKVDRMALHTSGTTTNPKAYQSFGDMQILSDDETDIDVSDQGNCESIVPQEMEKATNHNEFPPKLKTIEASLFNGFGESIFLANQKMSCLTYMDIYNSFFSTVNTGSHPLPKSIKTALMGSNYIKQIHKGFFPRNNSLMFLDIHDNILGPSFAKDLNGTIFERLEKTHHLDVRTNFIYDLPKHFFRGLIKLKWLRLSNNSLRVLNTSFSNMNIRYIDLSDNSIAWISKHSRDDLDRIALLHPLYIDLTNNPLPCTCNMLDVLHWMEGTNVDFLNKDILMCRFDDGSEDHIGDIKVRLRTLQRLCATKSITFVICVASMIVIGVLVGFALLYRFRWRLRYIRYIVMARFAGFKPKATLDNGFKFDAYLLYTEETRKFVLRDCVRELEEKRGHNLCFEDRNFMPGSPIVSGIVSAVNNSHKTVPVVTPEFYEGDFSEYGVKMAVMEEIFKKRLVLHLCIYQPTPSETMSCDFLVAMKRNDFTEFPHDQEASEEIIQNFWDQLSLAIGHTGSMDYSHMHLE